MSDRTESFLKQNGLLVAVALAFVGVGLYWAVMRPEAVTATTSSGGVVQSNVDQPLPKHIAQTQVAPSRWAHPSRSGDVQSSVVYYETQLANDPDSEATPANLFRLGNLYYSNLLDWDKASTYYERLLQEYPDYPNNNTVFPNLAACYKRMGNFELERYTYKRMMEYFPPHTQDYAFAKSQLGL
jgi:tetratricopeptide (TPR) repeat protein